MFLFALAAWSGLAVVQDLPPLKAPADFGPEWAYLEAREDRPVLEVGDRLFLLPGHPNSPKWRGGAVPVRSEFRTSQTSRVSTLWFDCINRRVNEVDVYNLDRANSRGEGSAAASTGWHSGGDAPAILNYFCSIRAPEGQAWDTAYPEWAMIIQNQSGAIGIDEANILRHGDQLTMQALFVTPDHPDVFGLLTIDVDCARMTARGVGDIRSYLVTGRYQGSHPSDGTSFASPGSAGRAAITAACAPRDRRAVINRYRNTLEAVTASRRAAAGSL